MIAGLAVAACVVMFSVAFAIDLRHNKRERAWHRHCDEAIRQSRYEYLEHVEVSS